MAKNEQQILRAAELTCQVDDDPEGMFPLRSAAEVAKELGMSTDWVHSAFKTGDLPYVEMTLSGRKRRGDGQTGRKERMVRADHIRRFVLDRTVE